MNGKVVGLAFIVTLAIFAIAYAITTDQIWSNIYVPGATPSLRVTAVP